MLSARPHHNLADPFPRKAPGRRSVSRVLALLVIVLSPTCVSALTVTDMAPAPGTTLTSTPTALTVTLSQPADGSTINANTVRVVRAGPDGVFGTADDVGVIPAGISTNGNQINIDLTGVKLPNDHYQLTLGQNSSGPSGNTNYFVGTQPSGIAVGDVNGDGFPDLVVSNVQSQNVSVLLGNGSGGFAPAVNFPIGAFGWSVSLADFNGDGLLDIVVATGIYNSCRVLMNTSTPGTLGFSAPTSFTAGNNVSFVVAKDFNGDGKPDLVVANQGSNTIGVLINTTPALATTPSFSSMYSFAVQQTPRAVTVADINGDGLPDVAVANYASNSISVLLNTTTALSAVPTFTSVTNFAVGQNPYHVELLDLNRDGKPDIIEPNYSSNSVGVLFNTTPTNGSTPTFAAPVYLNMGTNPHFAFAGDLNGDGLPDIISNNHTSNTVQIAFNHTPSLGTTPVFDPPIQVTVSSTPGALRIADLTGSGGMGAIVANESGAPSILSVLSGFTSSVIKDASGNPLDGKFTGTFPSGDSTYSNFTASFTIAAPQLQVTALTPAPNAVLTSTPANIIATFNKNIDPASVGPGTVHLIGAGPDNQFGTADDITIAPTGISINANTIKLDLTGISMPGGKYQVVFSQQGLPGGLVAQWKLDESTGTVAHDSSGHGHDGTLFNNPTWTPGKINGGLKFDGTNYVEVPFSSELNAAAFTVSAWARLDSNASNFGSVVTSRDNFPTKGYILYGSSIDNHWEYWTGENLTHEPYWNYLTGNPITLGQYTHLTGTYDGTTLRFYQDGIQVSAITASVTPNSSRPLRIGAGTTEVAPDYFFNGVIDEVCIFNRALTASEVSHLVVPPSITDFDGNPLDGEFSGTFPSGDSTPGGDFRAGISINNSPVAIGQALSLHSGASIPVTLSATDADGDPVVYAVVSPPSHGTLSGTLPNLTYTSSGFSGQDSFTFKVNDGFSDSNIATIALTIGNTAPVASDLTVSTHFGVAVAVPLSASDAESDALVYSIVSAPSHGTLSGTLPNLTYSSPGYAGPDSFTFKVNDGLADSNTATVSINVTNTAPVASNFTTSTHSGVAVAVTLSATDADGDALAFSIVSAPSHGTLSGTLPNLTYSSSGYAGPDSFSFKVNDGLADSNTATVSINVTNTAPVASNLTTSTHSGVAVAVTLSATDADGDALAFRIASAPSHGTLSGTLPNLTYSSSGYAGPDSFTFKVNDGLADSNTATVAVNITNTAPVASSVTVSTHSGVTVAITLPASDADGDALLFSIVTPPAHGTLSGTLPLLFYTPSSPFSGVDTLSFKVNDQVADSNIATVTVKVNNQAPTVSASASPVILQEGQSTSFASAASDPDNDALTWLWNFGDGSTSVEVNPSHTYAVAGVYSAILTVTDIAGAQAVATPITIHVFHDSDRPTARFVSNVLNGYVGQPVGFDATLSTDPRNNIVSYVWDFGDGSPQGSGQAIARVYAQTGTYTVTLTITDGEGLSDTTALTMVVLPADQSGLFVGTFAYKVNWNRATTNADSLALTANLNVGDSNIASTQTLALNLVGQTFTGSSGTKQTFAGNGGALVKFQLKPDKRKGSPKGQVTVAVSIKHATLGKAFALAGAVGTKTATARIPIQLSIGTSSFAAAINSQFRFGGNGAKASGSGQGPK